MKFTIFPASPRLRRASNFQFSSALARAPLIFFILYTLYFILYTPVHAIDLSQDYAFGNIKSLGEGVRLLVVPTFSIAAAVVVGFLIFGGIKYMTSGGEKEAVSSAQGMITHAIIGFIILMMLFALMQFLSEPTSLGLPDIIGK